MRIELSTSECVARNKADVAQSCATKVREAYTTEWKLCLATDYSNASGVVGKAVASA